MKLAPFRTNTFGGSSTGPPVGQFAVASCKLRGVARIIVIDAIDSRLDIARQQGAECIQFNKERPVEVLKELTNGTLADVVIDAVGIDAYTPSAGPGVKEAEKNKKEFTED